VEILAHRQCELVPGSGHGGFNPIDAPFLARVHGLDRCQNLLLVALFAVKLVRFSSLFLKVWSNRKRRHNHPDCDPEYPKRRIKEHRVTPKWRRLRRVVLLLFRLFHLVVVVVVVRKLKFEPRARYYKFICEN